MEKQTCARCAHIHTRTLPATGNPNCVHVFGAWTVNAAATCTEDGERERHCTNCPKNEVEEIIKLGHDWNAYLQTLAPTCSAAGSETRSCKRNASHTETRDIAIAAAAHNWGNYTQTTAPTCTAVGKETRTCGINGSHTETRDIAIVSTAHNWGNYTQTTAPTCTAVGKETRTCGHNSSHTETVDINALGHANGSWVVTVPATTSSAGTKVLRCVRYAQCNHVISSETIPIIVPMFYWGNYIPSSSTTLANMPQQTFSIDDLIEHRDNARQFYGTGPSANIVWGTEYKHSETAVKTDKAITFENKLGYIYFIYPKDFGIIKTVNSLGSDEGWLSQEVDIDSKEYIVRYIPYVILVPGSIDYIFDFN